MANHMECYVRVVNLTPEGETFLKEIFKSDEGEYEFYSGSVLKKLYGSTDEEIEDREYRTENIGSKWIHGYVDHIEDGEAAISTTSAWSVPYQMFLQFSDLLVKYSPDAIITGTYEDEGYDPCGAFIIAKNYEDIEDVFGTGDVDYDKLWEDDDYRDSISEKLHDETAHMLEAHQEYLREIAEEEKA
tara:strand:+ start:3603 stop:4163 length:561 start_codon:yes stop_codon:yes gene_type:complete